MQRRDFIKTTSLAAMALASTKLYAFGHFSQPQKGQINVLRPECKIPVIYHVDVLVVGGSSAAVVAAASAKQQGASVCLVASEPYLGQDICGTYNFWQKKQEYLCQLSPKIWETPGVPPTPLHVKSVLDKVLMLNEIPFLLSSYTSNVLFDEKNNPAGIVIANRSGEQIIKAKIIVDATSHATVAHLAGVEFSKFKKGKRNFTFRVLGNKPKQGLSYKQLSPAVKSKEKEYKATEYQLEIPVKEDTTAAYAEAYQTAIDKTWDLEQVDASHFLFEIPPEKMAARSKNKSADFDPEKIDFDCFLPENTDRLFVLSAYSGVSDSAARQMLVDSDKYMFAGRQIGLKAGQQAQKTSKSQNSKLKNPGKLEISKNQKVKQHVSRMRSQHHVESLKIDSETIPVLGNYEVLIVGGGTAGACAGISASREGAKTLVLEYTHGLGGMGTLGLIGRYWHGFRKGFTSEIDKGVPAMAPADHPRQREKNHEWVKEWKMEWYRKEIRNAGGEIWHNVLACGAVVEENTVKGVVIATPKGKGIVLADKIIDSTGSADIAISAGAEYQFIDKDVLAVQGAGLPLLSPGDFYNNTDWTFIDDTDVFDVSRVQTVAKKKYPDQYDAGILPQTRERRRIVSDFQVTAQDMLNNRTYPDTLSYHISSFDTHGFTISPIFTLNPPKGSSIDMNAFVPIRSLLPKKLENIIVTGLGADAHRDAMPVIRMQPCLQNQGYNVGVLAAHAAREGKTFRNFDIKKVQKKWVEKGTLPASVLTDKDNYPTDKEPIQAAIDKLKDDKEQLNFILWNKDLALPLLRKKLRQSDDKAEKLRCAYVLGLHGIDDGWQELKEKLDHTSQWDEGWNYRGMGQFGKSSSYLDGLLMALGQTKRKEALPTLHRWAKRLGADSEFSHFRAIAVALENIKSPQSAEILAEILTMPGVSNYATTSLREAYFYTVTKVTDTSIRNKVLREIVLARALYRCGDKNGLGKQILTDYSNDLHGIYSLHTRGVLEENA